MGGSSAESDSPLEDDVDGLGQDDDIDTDGAEKPQNPDGSEASPAAVGHRPESVETPNKKSGRSAKAKKDASLMPALGGKGKKGKSGGKGGRPSAVKNGMKWCRACNKTMETSCFPIGPAVCLDDKPATQNIANAATMQGKEECWADVFTNDRKFQRCVRIYHRQYPKQVSKKRPRPDGMVVEQEYYFEQQLIKDG